MHFMYLKQKKVDNWFIMSDCTILILTYKGKHHLEHLLPTVRNTILNSSEYSIDVLIVDNGCDEPTKNFVNESFPEFRLEWSTKNDYLFSLNQYVLQLNSKFVYILNDDIRLHPEVINESLPIIMNDAQLFSVGFKVLDWEGVNTTISVRKLKISNGWYQSFFVPFKDQQIRYSLYGAGGAAVFRTAFFNTLDGFNNLYRPAYAEDLDIGHRAWHRGWPSIINPRAILYHREGGTIHEQFTSDALEQKVRKNQFLWMWRNGRKPGFIILFFLLLPMRLFSWRKTNRNLYLALRMALKDFPKAILQRWNNPKPQCKDAEIIEKLNQVYEIRK